MQIHAFLGIEVRVRLLGGCVNEFASLLDGLVEIIIVRHVIDENRSAVLVPMDPAKRLPHLLLLIHLLPLRSEIGLNARCLPLIRVLRQPSAIECIKLFALFPPDLNVIVTRLVI